VWRFTSTVYIYIRFILPLVLSLHTQKAKGNKISSNDDNK